MLHPNWAKIDIFLSTYFLNCSLCGMDDRKKVSSLNLSWRWMLPFLCNRSLSSAWFYLKSVPFYLKYLKCGRLNKIIFRLSTYESSRRKIGDRQPKRLQNEGKVTAWLRMVSSIVAALLTPFFTSKNHTLNVFLKKVFLWTQSSRSQRIFLRRPCKFHPEEKFKHV